MVKCQNPRPQDQNLAILFGMRNALTLPFNSVIEQARGKFRCLDDLLHADVLHLRLGGIRHLKIVNILRRVRDGAWDTLAITEDRHPVLRTLAFEFKDVRLVVADVVKQLVLDRPFIIEAPAPQGFQTDLPSGSDLPFGHYRVVHLLLQD